MNLEFKNISKQYAGKMALQGFDCSLGCGVHALLGPNGAGKTTLMNILTGLLKPTTGEVLYDGKNTIRMGGEFLDVLGYLPQNPGFYPSFTGYEILKYFADLKGMKKPKEKIEELLELVNLKNDAKRKCGGYSGGMKRRLGIAVALLNNPKVLVLDEPTAGLDPKERMRFRNVIGQIGFERIVILATHIVSDIESIADDVILLQNGKFVLQGTIEKLEESIQGKVWEVFVSMKEAEQYVAMNATANIKKEGKEVALRIVSDEKPFENAVHIEDTTLEDVYMYYFKENGMRQEKE